MPHILVTGVNGFVGNHVVNALRESGFEVSGLAYGETFADKRLKNSLTCDLADKNRVAKLDLSPYRAIINLAGLANVRQSFENPELYATVNVGVLENICERALQQGLTPRIIAVSTGAVYDSAQSMPLTESSRLIKGGSPYAQSKLLMERVAEKYRKYGIPECIVARPFNHIGPGQKEGFIVPDLYGQLVGAQKTGRPIVVGNLTTRRDYTDVRDVARAYARLATVSTDALTSRIYNICSGHSRSGEEILAELKNQLPNAKNIGTVVNSSLVRPQDPKELLGSYKIIHKDTGWEPSIMLEKTITDFVTARAN